jgi:hypothetical protein
MPYLRAIRQPRLRWIVTADHVIPPTAELAMAQHAEARIVKGRRLPPVMISRPAAVTRLIVAAARSTS